MTAKQFYPFVEDNDHEGEMWTFYVPMTDEEANHILNLLELAREEYPNIPYQLSDPIGEHVVDLMVECGNGHDGYHAAHTKCAGAVGDISELTLDDVLEDDIFYKGTFWSYV